MKERERQITRVTLLGSVINMVLAALKMVAGIVGRSGAMVADGIHSLSDLVSDIVVLIFVPMSSKSRDDGHKYGHGKFETLATLIVSLILVVVAAKLIATSVEKIIFVANGNILPKPGYIALIAASVSILSKEFLYQYTLYVGKKTNSAACKANAWHHRSDAFSSIGSLIGIGGAIVLGDKWTILDPIAAVVIGLMILVVAVKMFKPPFDELMEKSLGEQTEQQIKDIITSTQGVKGMHKLKTRCNGQSKIIECHILVERTNTIVQAHDIATEVENKLEATFGDNTQISIHIEPLAD